MKSVALVSASGAPGVTVTAQLLAMGLGEPLTVVELGQSGGTLAGMCGLRWRPSTLELAAATRSEMTSALLAAHAQHPPATGVPVVVGPSNALQALGVVKTLIGPITQALRSGRLGELLVLDCGQLIAKSVLWTLVAQVDVTLVVVGSSRHRGETAARLFHAQGLIHALRQLHANVGAVIVGTDDARSVAAQLAVPVVAVIPARDEMVTAVWAGIPARDKVGVRTVINELARRSRALHDAQQAGLGLVAGREEMGLSR